MIENKTDYYEFKINSDGEVKLFDKNVDQMVLQTIKCFRLLYLIDPTTSTNKLNGKCFGSIFTELVELHEGHFILKLHTSGSLSKLEERKMGCFKLVPTKSEIFLN